MKLNGTYILPSTYTVVDVTRMAFNIPLRKIIIDLDYNVEIVELDFYEDEFQKYLKHHPELVRQPIISMSAVVSEGIK